MAELASLRKETCSPSDHAGVYVGLEHIDSGYFSLKRHGAPQDVRSAKSRFHAGDVLYGKLRPYLDKALVADCEGICSTDILVMEPRGVPAWFLCGLLHTDRFIEHAKQTTHGVNHPRTSWVGVNVFENVRFSRAEQEKIATVLLKIQRAIETQDRMIQALRDLKKSTLQHVFTRGLRGEKTKMTDIGEVPESWEVVPLSAIAAIERGKFSHRPRNDPAFYGGDIPFVQTRDVTRSNGRIREYSQTLNNRGLSVSKMFSAGTILITIAANIGDTGILEFDSAFPDSIVGITPNSRVLSQYLEFFLRTQQQRMHLLAPKGTQMNINIAFLKPWPISLPSIEEQREIAQILGGLNEKQDACEVKKTALQSLFKTALNKLMSGEIRVGDMKITTAEVER